MHSDQVMLSCVVFLVHVLLGSIYCQDGGSCAITATSLGCAKYRVLGLVTNSGNFLRVNPDGSYTGFIWDLLNALKATTPFDFTLSLQADGVYGAPDAYGVWNGLVGQLVGNTTDIVIAHFTFSPERLMVIDYTVPFMPVHFVIISQPNASLANIKYCTPGSSVTVAYLRDSKESRAQEIWASVQANMPTSLVADDIAGLALVRQGGWAYISGDVTVAEAVKASYGQLVINKPALQTSYLALGLQLGSPLRRPLSIALAKIMATGQMDELRNKWNLAD